MPTSAVLQLYCVVEIEIWIEMSKVDELGCKVMTIPHMDPDNIGIYQSQLLMCNFSSINLPMHRNKYLDLSPLVRRSEDWYKDTH